MTINIMLSFLILAVGIIAIILLIAKSLMK